MRDQGKNEEAAQLIKSAGNIPLFHYFQHDGGFINDTNAFFCYKGIYHLFYQWSYSIDGSGIKHWRHVTSEDLFHWTDRGVALYPDKWYDTQGVWSGQACFDKDGNPYVVYYGNLNGICIARPADLADPYLTEWVKDDANPVIPIHNQNDPYIVYDPSNVFIVDDTYYLLTGNKTATLNGPMSYLFKSFNLTDWQFVGEFINPNGTTEKIDDMACPNVAYMGNDIWLVVYSSHQSGVYYYTGRFVNEKFDILQSGRFNNYGGNEMGSSLMADSNGRVVYITWLTEVLTGAELSAQGWNGLFCIPRELTCDSDGTLRIKPVDEIEQFRGEKQTFSELVANGQTKSLGVSGSYYEMNVKINMLDAVRAGFKLAVGNGEETLLYYDMSDNKIHIDFSNSSNVAHHYNKYIFEFMRYEYQGYQTSAVHRLTDRTLNLRIFMDNTVLEVYVDGVLSMSRRIYPDDTSTGIQLFAEGGTAFFESIEYYAYSEAAK